jgi:hypothetical protein
VTVALLEREIEHLETLNLEGLRSFWRERYGAPPTNRSPELLRYMLAWRIQATANGGLDRATSRALNRTGPIAVEGSQLGVGAIIRREWKGRRHDVVVVEHGFSWNDRTFRSLSAVAQAITGTKWNGPRFFGLRGSPS